MLKKKERATTTELSQLKAKNTKNKKVFSGEFLDVATYPSEKTKIACIISKKRISLSVDRNRIKRKLLHTIKGFLPKKGGLIVFYPKKNFEEAKKEEIISEIKTAFDKI